MGHRIQERRKSLRLSQEELAERADISKQTVSRIENGEREMGARTIARLVKALGVSADYLLFGEFTDVDVGILNQNIAGLTGLQFKFLDDLIRSFAKMCKESSN